MPLGSRRPSRGRVEHWRSGSARRRFEAARSTGRAPVSARLRGCPQERLRARVGEGIVQAEIAHPPRLQREERLDHRIGLPRRRRPGRSPRGPILASHSLFVVAAFLRVLALSRYAVAASAGRSPIARREAFARARERAPAGRADWLAAPCTGVVCGSGSVEAAGGRRSSEEVRARSRLGDKALLRLASRPAPCGSSRCLPTESFSLAIAHRAACARTIERQLASACGRPRRSRTTDHIGTVSRAVDAL